jgi:large subunit ribosomal protein L24
MHVRTGDTVMVLAGKDRGKTGKIQRVVTQKNRAVVDGVNIVKRHLRRLPNRPGGIVEMPAPLHVSNLMLVCPHCGRPARTGHRVEADGTKVRYCKKCHESVRPAETGRPGR